MFVEYMALKDKKEAQSLLDASAKLKPTEQDEVYIVKEKEQYQFILKIKKFKKKFKEQKWFLYPGENGIKAKREMNAAYIAELIVTIISAILCVMFMAFSFIWPDNMAILIWLALVSFLIFLFVSWRKLFKPSVSLKIFLIRIL